MLSSTSFALPSNFKPGENQIIIGRGRATRQHIGNRKFASMIAAVSVEYAAAPNKTEKGTILTRLIKIIHEQSDDAGFVKRDHARKGGWIFVDEVQARQTAAQAIRNHLQGAYKSSSQSRQKIRYQKLQEEEGELGFQYLNAAVSGWEQRDEDNSLSSSCSSSRSASPSLQACLLQHAVSFSNSNHQRNSHNNNSHQREISTGSNHSLKATSDTVSILLDKFCPIIDPTDNPFEPRPLSTTANVKADDDDNGFLDIDIEPLPL